MSIVANILGKCNYTSVVKKSITIFLSVSKGFQIFLFLSQIYQLLRKENQYADLLTTILLIQNISKNKGYYRIKIINIRILFIVDMKHIQIDFHRQFRILCNLHK